MITGSQCDLSSSSNVSSNPHLCRARRLGLVDTKLQMLNNLVTLQIFQMNEENGAGNTRVKSVSLWISGFWVFLFSFVNFFFCMFKFIITKMCIFNTKGNFLY